MSEHGLEAASMKEGFFDYKTSKVHFIKFGNGKKLLIALHGFGDQAKQFLALEDALKNDYTVYAINLPYHGQTQWREGSFSKKNITELFDIVLKREQKARFELMGYSYGGRIILASLYDIINHLDKIYLIAPDGFKTKGMFSAMIIPVWLRRIIKGSINNPEGLIRILEKCYKIGMLSRFNFNFIKKNISTEERRERIFNTWISLSDFKINLTSTRKFLKESAIPVELYFGKYDKIIPPEVGEKLSSKIPNIGLNLIEEGHLLLNEKLNRLIKDQLIKS